MKFFGFINSIRKLFYLVIKTSSTRSFSCSASFRMLVLNLRKSDGLIESPMRSVGLLLASFSVTVAGSSEPMASIISRDSGTPF